MSEIEYFYAAHSVYAYIGSRRLMEIARTAGRPLRHKPYDLRRGMEGIGGTPFRQRSKAHYAYFFGREVVRWSEHRGVPMLGRRPTHHDNDIGLPNCVLIAAQERGDNVDELAHALLEAHWREDADLADAATLARLAKGIGADAEALLAAAGSAPIRAIYEANTNEAIRRSVFGSPTYFVDGDMFYGQDHLEMVERALKTPYQGRWPSV